MTHFLGTHQNRLDAKGRVSVPASFRAALKALGNGENGVGSPVILRPSHQYPCIEGWSQQAFEALARPLNDYDDFSQEQDDLATTLYASAYMMETDKEGRIVLPAELVAHANLTEMVVFMGLGKRFQIWEPEAAERRRAEASARANAKGLTLKGAAAQ
jgi:MraZ protein